MISQEQLPLHERNQYRTESKVNEWVKNRRKKERVRKKRRKRSDRKRKQKQKG
jgi:hypothetical protein